MSEEINKQTSQNSKEAQDGGANMANASATGAVQNMKRVLSRLVGGLRRNPGFSLAGLNLFLALTAFLIFDPFGWIRTGYQSAEPLLRVQVASIDALEIRGPESEFKIRREDAIARPEKRTEEGAPPPTRESEILEASEGFLWSLQGPGVDFRADARRLARLLYSLERSKKYYELDWDGQDNPESQESRTTLMKYGLDKPLKLDVVLENGQRKEILIGRSSIRGNESYVLVDQTIYLVQENLRRDLGSGDAEYFRNRQIMPFITRREVKSIKVRFRNPAAAGLRNVELAQAGGEWRMLAPSVGPVRETEMNLLIDDLLEIRAQEFLQEIPPGLDRRDSMDLEIVYARSMGNPESMKLEILGKKSYDTYLFRLSDGTLFEGSSLYLEKLFQPEQALLQIDEPQTMDFPMQ
ncbi:MAG: DUF4340 domain-containing protein [Leptospiraceae bacterium]|nr:DUF4340 domain-containing protein [Leptospiraceae bacterium]